MDRNDTIKRIRAALKRRSGKPWSVTGGRGTAWGWLTIDAPPARRIWERRLKDPGAPPDVMVRPDKWIWMDTANPGTGSMSPDERAELAALLAVDEVHHQGVSIPAGHDYWQEYIDRAEGREPAKVGVPYWD